jgi:hypothetical protein
MKTTVDEIRRLDDIKLLYPTISRRGPNNILKHTGNNLV